MDIKLEKTLLIKELKQVNDISLLRALKHMIHYGLKTEGRITVDQYNRELNEAETRVAQGQFYSQSEVEKMLKND